MKVIDLLNMISKGEKLPDYVKYFNRISEENDTMMPIYDNIIYKLNCECIKLNDEVEILEAEISREETDKDIPLIPDDELIILKQEKAIDMQKAIDYNFKVLKEKINQVVEELNGRKNGKEDND